MLIKIFNKVTKQVEKGKWFLRILDRRRFDRSLGEEIHDIFDERTLEERFRLNSAYVIANEWGSLYWPISSTCCHKEKGVMYEDAEEAVVNFILYKWCIDHEKLHYKVMDHVVVPRGIIVNLKDVSFSELLEFFSPDALK